MTVSGASLPSQSFWSLWEDLKQTFLWCQAVLHGGLSERFLERWHFGFLERGEPSQSRWHGETVGHGRSVLMGRSQKDGVLVLPDPRLPFISSCGPRRALSAGYRAPRCLGEFLC